MSLPLSDTVDIVITQETVGVARQGFGVPMLLSYYAAWPTDRVRSYSSLGEVAADFPVTTSPEYRFALAAFSQSPKPKTIMIGRGDNKPTLVHTLTPVVRNAHTYRVKVAGKGFATTEVSFTSDSDATASEIVTGLIAALNAVSGKNYTATGSTTLVITADTAGEWFQVEAAPADFANIMSGSDPGVAADLTAIALVSNAWYALTTVYNAENSVKAAAGWCEAAGKLYAFDTTDTDSLGAADGTNGTLDDLKTLAYRYTAGSYHPYAGELKSAAWLGKCLPYTPGQETWKFKTLAGISTVNLNSTQRANLRARNANCYEESSGVNMTWDGKVANGDFIDGTRNRDWLVDDMSKRIFELLASLPKVAFTNPGIALFDNAMRGSLKQGARQGVLIPAGEVGGWVTTVPLAEDISSADKVARHLPDLYFDCTFQGAVHSAGVRGVIRL